MHVDGTAITTPMAVLTFEHERRRDQREDNEGGCKGGSCEYSSKDCRLLGLGFLKVLTNLWNPYIDSV